jgi:exodeoxyribonuclease VII large subunit
MDEEHVYTVSELNRRAREAIEVGLGTVWVKGEVSEIKRAPSGHLYFTLTDGRSELSAIRFRSRLPGLIDTPIEPGTVVLAFGKLTIYEPRGRYQFVASLVQPVGEGALQAAFERLKRKLEAEGLFDAAHKKRIPGFPQRIAVVTSPTGAALRDIVSVLRRRWPSTQVYLFPTTVQGEQAPAELIAALDRAARFSATVEPLDVLILGRGGGSTEDLIAFSHEQVARAVFACPIPIVSAVGHEIDFAITDFVADLRAPTPSAAAELATPDVKDILETSSMLAAGMTRTIATALEARTAGLRANLKAYLFRIPKQKIETIEQRLDQLLSDLMRSSTAAFRLRTENLARQADLLRLSDPRLPLRRGYSLTFLKDAKVPLRDSSDVVPGCTIETRLDAGRLSSRVEEVMDK